MMFPINRNQPYLESGLPDTRFQENAGQYSGGRYNGKRYFVCAAGKPLHGLNVHNTIVNRLDFDKAVAYANFSFVSDTKTGDFESRWNGNAYVGYARRFSTTQISGFRCGDVNLIKVPGFNPKRTATEFDKSKLLRWKSYALVSGAAKYAFGYAMGSKTWICTFGVGRSYSLTFKGSSGGAGVSRKFDFYVGNFGVIGEYAPGYDLLHDTGKLDYQAHTQSDLLTDNIATVMHGLEKWRIEDYSKNGQKVIISGYYGSEGSVSYEDDGVNDCTTSPVVWLEFSFREVGDAIQVTHRVLKNYASDTGDGVNLIQSFTPSFTDFGGKVNQPHMRAVIQVSQKREFINNAPPGALYLDIGYLWRAYEVQGDAGSPTVEVTYPGHGDDSGLPGTFMQMAPLPGYADQMSVTGTGTIRVVHMCYDSNDNVTSVRAKFTSYRATLNECLSIEYSGSAWKKGYQPGASGETPVRFESGGLLTITRQSERSTISGTSFELIAGSKSIGHLRTATRELVTAEVSTITWSPITGYSSESVPSLPADNRASSSPAFAVGNLYAPFGIFYSTLESARHTFGFFRDDGVPVGTPGHLICPFIRVESNKLVSFNIGTANGSMQIEEQKTGTTGLFPISYPVLTAGKHKYRWVYDMYNGTLLKNTDLQWGASANPAINIDSDRYNCTLNPATNEAVLNSQQAVCYV